MVENESIKSADAPDDTPIDSKPTEASADAASTASASAFAQPEGTPVKVWDAIKRSWLIYYGTHRNGVVYSVACAVIGVCILLFGFWSVLLIVVMAGAGLAYGQYRDGDPRIVSFFQRHFGS